MQVDDELAGEGEGEGEDETEAKAEEWTTYCVSILYFVICMLCHWLIDWLQFKFEIS